jgi:hypothetical protein
MTIKALYPTVRPTLNLNFARTKALDRRVTFTRASTGTFVGSNGLIQTAASGAARFDHNGATGESLGLLVEEARTNNVLYSEQFDNAAWIKVNATVTTNQAIAPDGTLTMDELTDDATSSTHRCVQSFTSLVSNFTISAYVKYKNISWVYLNYFTYGCAFNIQTGVVGTPTANATSPSITPVGNGVYRISVNITNYVGVDGIYLGLSTGDSIMTSYIGTGSSAFIWGLQAEAGSFPTSYIPTSGATVTRAADVASMTGTNFSSWYNNNQGTYFLNAVTLNGSTATNTTQDNLIDDGYVYIQDYVGASVRRRVIASASGAFNFNPAQAPSRRVAVAFDSSSANVAYNGILQSVDTTVSGLPNTASSLRIGATITSAALVDQGYITRLAYYPVRLPDAQLQALTR